MKAAIRFHLEGLRRHHLPLPKASAAAEVLEVA
jgi:predicted RNase H-like HicB family nuclease